MDRRQALATGIAIAITGGAATAAGAAAGGIPILGMGDRPSTDLAAVPTSTEAPATEVPTSVVYLDDIVVVPTPEPVVATTDTVAAPIVTSASRSATMPVKAPSTTAPRPAPSSTSAPLPPVFTTAAPTPPATEAAAAVAATPAPLAAAPAPVAARAPAAPPTQGSQGGEEHEDEHEDEHEVEHEVEGD